MPFLLTLWREAMTVHFAAAGISPVDENPLRRLSMRFECAAIVSLEDRPFGLLKVARDGSDWKLIQILIAPEAQRRGIGGLLVRNLISEAQANGASLSLSVLKCNPARQLYLRLGFVVMREEEHAFEMRFAGQPVAEVSEHRNLHCNVPCLPECDFRRNS